MNNIGDLNIEKEVLPLFDYSLNIFTTRKILQMLETPLSSKEEIIDRQEIDGNPCGSGRFTGKTTYVKQYK